MYRNQQESGPPSLSSSRYLVYVPSILDSHGLCRRTSKMPMKAGVCEKFIIPQGNSRK